MGPIKRYVVYWTEKITGLVGGVIMVIIILLAAVLLRWVESTDLGQMTGLCCLILFISIMLISERYGETKDLNDFDETVFMERYGIVGLKKDLNDYGETLSEEE